ncbi:MAG: hypothetical protein F4213_12630 [Boseongicola sp. SB0677_bin_26]|nr:hypothetical protein [Boseongicola sp. SB0665_bin_10]MYG26848.1 hypothetical protein [Boseongicola sp. SB0677_bin_26]
MQNLIAESDSDNPADATIGRNPAVAQTNFERLIQHLPEGSLSAKLVAAYAAPANATPDDAVAKVAATRLNELKRIHDDTENQLD